MELPKLQSVTALKLTTSLNILLGAWLFWSPWEFGVDSSPNAWNSWIVGATIAALAVIRLVHPLGSQYTSETSRFVNSVCVGMLILILAGFGSFDPDRS
jgi:hypothetical protein